MSSQTRTALVIEDEMSIRELLCSYLRDCSFLVVECADGVRGVEHVTSASFDLIVLDIQLPGMDGLQVCETIRSGGLNAAAPVVIVTGRTSEADRVIGLDCGADDYITKPFGKWEFLARIRAITRRRERGTPEGVLHDVILPRGPLTIDVSRRIVLLRGEPIELSRQEFDLLHLLASRRGRVFTRTALVEAVWKHDAYVTERTVDAVISRLRRKLERDHRDPHLILTAWGVGYRFADLD